MRNISIITTFLCLFNGVLYLQAQNKTEVMRLTLDEAIAFAMDSSYQGQTALQDVYKSKKKIWETTAIGLPQVAGSLAYNRNIEPMTNAFSINGERMIMQFGTPHDMSSQVTMSQLIFDGSYLVGLQSARTVAKINELAKEKTDILVTEAVSYAYVGVLISDETIEILKRNIENVESNIRDIRAMFENGLAEEQDVQQLELTLSSLNNSMNQGKRLANINREMLKFAMGMNIFQPIELTDDIEKVLLDNYQVTSLQDALNLEGHIDFQVSLNNLKANDLLIRYEKTKYMPNLAAFVNAGYSSYSDVFDFFGFNHDKWYGMAIVGVQMNIPVFSGFQRKARVDMARIDYEKARLQHRQTIQNLYRELHVAQDAYAYSLDNLKTTEKNLKLAESIERKENIKYQEGISTSLDLANAQNQLYTSQQNYLNAILLVVQSKISLDKALNKL